MAASVYIVVGLSIDRFVAVCYPRKYRNLYRHHVATVRIAMSFVVAFIIYIPMMVFHQRVEEAEGSRDLYLAKDRHDVRNSPLFIAYACLLELCARLAPALMLAYLNSRIIIEFKMISARRKLLSQGIGCSEVSGYPSPSANDHSLAAPQNDDNGSPQYQTTSSPNSLEVGQQREGSALLLEAVIDGTAGSKCGHEAQKKTASGVDNGEAIAMISSGRCLQMSSSAIRKGERRHDRERRLVLLLVSIIVTFFVTNIPAAILSLITYKDSYRQNLGFQIFRAVANNLEFLNYGLSFLLYFLFSKDIRGVFVTLLKTAIKSIGKTLYKGRSSSGRTSANL
ncbi:hypothetical protein HAZT_HAZT011138 [Hyalella azteca]|uniref:G-protein coupled receptors family 1 profile domain-containing protein n=1 Tax=Hyalella azteca TaxID=294128 RepID=A0A6A0H3B8_HYAAZ|nr:hypothetical protein HAZT_HAZT011138 [Hyalella azteca]